MTGDTSDIKFPQSWGTDSQHPTMARMVPHRGIPMTTVLHSRNPSPGFWICIPGLKQPVPRIKQALRYDERVLLVRFPSLGWIREFPFTLQANEYVDARDTDVGSWFEAKVVRVTKKPPSQDTPSSSTSSQDTPCNSASSQDTPCSSTPSQDTPCSSASSKDMPCSSASSQDTPCSSASTLEEDDDVIYHVTYDE